MDLPLYQLHDSHRMNRRSFLAGTASLAVAALWSSRVMGAVTRAPVFPAYPFQLGVASGDPEPESVVIWTRLAPKPLEGGGMPWDPVEVSWQVAEDDAMTRVVQSGVAIANPDWAHSVHVEVHGLRPDRWYWYRFKAGAEESPVGRTRTMPARGAAPERLRFAFASCQHYEDGFYTAYEHMAREDLDLIVHLGDYIYEGAANKRTRVREHERAVEPYTLADYRNRHARYKSDPALQEAHRIVPWIVTWDDHEVDNNYAGDHSQDEAKGVATAELLRRRAAAYQAYYEHMPLRRASLPAGPYMQLYRKLEYGSLASFHVLDTRQHRTDQPCGDGRKPPCPEMFDPRATALGLEQRAWLFGGLDRSTATWNILAQQIMVARLAFETNGSFVHNVDPWAGYEHERRLLLKHLHERKVANPIVLTGDDHRNWANELVLDFEGVDSRCVAAEFVGTSISSGGDGERMPVYPERFFSDNPFVKFYNRERGYVRCDVTPAGWRTDYRVIEYVTRPGAPIATRKSFVVEAGRAGLQEG